MERISILIADDHTLLCETLELFLNGQPDIKVIARTASAEETLSKCAETNPNVVLLDITFPDRSGISILPDLRNRFPSSRALIVTMHTEPSYLRAAMAAGASGYLVKTSCLSGLLEAIRAVHSGETFIDPSMRTHLTEPAKGGRTREESPISRLSERERQVLRSLANGMRYQAIADELGVSVKTVETYRSRLTSKLGFTNRADMMRFAIESGILAPTSTMDGLSKAKDA